MEEKGTRVMFYTQNNMNILENEQKINQVMVTEVPKRFHNTPEVIESKQREYNNFLKFNAFEEIEDVGQSRIGSRWVVTEKESHDGMKTKTKSRLVVRGL